MPSSATLHRLQGLSALVAGSALVAACGGGSDAPPPPPPPPPAATTATITVKAADGLLQGAKGCYDINDNNVCDGTEQISGASDANGNFTLEVALAEVGKHRVVVDVPADAIDKDNNAAVGTAYRMTAPATGITTAHSVFVSPLTTAVQRHMESSGQTLAQARDYIQAQAGLNVSPLADFTAAANADNTKAANAARLALQTLQQQAAAVASALNQTDVSGTAITQAELDRSVAAKVTAALPSIGAAAGDPAVTGLAGQPRVDALAAAAVKIVTQIGFTVEQAKFDIGLAKLPPPPVTATPSEGAILPALQYTDAARWFYRYIASTVADNTPDANGMVRSYHVMNTMAPYAFQPTSGVMSTSNRTVNPELHWTGSAWGDCKVGERGDSNTVRDALGRSNYLSCNNFDAGTSQRGEIDISAQTLANVWTNRIAPEVAKTTNPGSWSLSPAGVALLGTTAVFPAGSRLFLQANTTTASAPAYNTLDSNRVTAFSVAVAQGGDARSGTPPCAQSPTAAQVTTLEQVVERNLGIPCIFNVGTDASGTSLDPNEAWGMTTTSLGTLATNVALPAGTGNYFTTSRFLRASFPGGTNTAYWSCLQRTNGGGTRNCTQIGSGSYSIATLGDARVMSFANLPAEALGLNSTRVFVERGGAVYFGYKNRVGAIFTSVRMNLPAANAMLAQLSLPIITPTEAPQALTGAKAANQALMKGVWSFQDAFGTGVLRVGDNGEYVLVETDAPSATERPGYERGWLEIDAQGKLSRLIALDTDGAAGTSHHNPATTLSVTDTTFTFTENGVTEGFDGRLPDSGTGIVGMWALDSATDLKTTQFVFFGNGKVLSIHPAETLGACATNRQGPPGIEWSDYEFNATTGALRILNKIYDTSGCTGAFDSADAVPNTETNLVLTIAADGKTFTVPVNINNGTVILTGYRIAPK